jgi:hypothetical protein
VRLRISFADEYAKEHPGDVGVEDGGSLAEGEAPNSAARVCANPLERQQSCLVRGQFATETRHRLACDVVETARANVVAERTPRFGYFLDGGIGQVPK